jgi:putative two-component system response regulator
MPETQEKIIVVDDEKSVRTLLQRILAEYNQNVKTAANGQEALEIIDREGIQIVFLDVKMPGMSGIDVLRVLATKPADYCVIMVTAMTDAQTAVQAMKLGAYDYIVKPFDRDDVISKMISAVQSFHSLKDDKRRQELIQKSIMERTQRMQDQFSELVSSLAREHKLLYQMASRQRDGGKAMLSKLPKELREPINSVDEFKNALLRILKRS